MSEYHIMNSENGLFREVVAAILVYLTLTIIWAFKTGHHTFVDSLWPQEEVHQVWCFSPLCHVFSPREPH